MEKWLDKFNTDGVLVEGSHAYKKKEGRDGQQCEDKWLSELASKKKHFETILIV